MCTKKMLEKDERSHYVYEKKGNKDKVSNGKSDIYVDMTRLLQRKAAYDSKSCGLSAETMRVSLLCGWSLEAGRRGDTGWRGKAQSCRSGLRNGRYENSEGRGSKNKKCCEQSH